MEAKIIIDGKEYDVTLPKEVVESVLRQQATISVNVNDCTLALGDKVVMNKGDREATVIGFTIDERQATVKLRLCESGDSSWAYLKNYGYTFRKAD